ncbi:MAG: alpha/beta hydrolase [Acidimicrobiia bacterium]
MGTRAGVWFGSLVATVVLSGLLVSCGTSNVADRTGALVWHGCGGIECTTLSVPLDWSHPNAARITLSLARRPASGRREGVLLTNPGGPGGSGVQLVQQATDAFDPSILDRFDIVSWDPRGVGASAPAECGSRLDYFYEVDRDDTDSATAATNATVSKRFAEDCEHTSKGLLPYLSTPATVQDMDAIRAAMGVATIDYLGFSYGTYIGALYADRYPSHVRSMVLDGAIDPAADYDDATIRQAVGFEHSLDAFLAWCRGNKACAFARGGDPTSAFNDLMTSISNETDPGTVQGEHRTLDIGEANIGVATALYGGAGSEGWGALSTALNDAARGNGAALLSLSDAYTGRNPGGTYDNETAAFYAIGCLDGPAPPTLASVEQLAKRAARVAPHFGASTVWLGLPCTYWPVAPVSRPGPIRAAGAPPIVVVGNTDDPATPYEQAEALAHELQSGRLLTYVGEGHTAYGRDNCIDNDVDRYLISLEVPAPGTRCH